jgi:hypothetical protein
VLVDEPIPVVEVVVQAAAGGVSVVDEAVPGATTDVVTAVVGVLIASCVTAFGTALRTGEAMTAVSVEGGGQGGILNPSSPRFVVVVVVEVLVESTRAPSQLLLSNALDDASSGIFDVNEAVVSVTTQF